MLKIRILLLVFALFYCGNLWAADLAPLVDSQTIAVGRVKLNQIDTERIMNFLNMEVRDVVPKIQPDQKEANRMMLTAYGSITFGAMYVQPILKTLQNEGKVDEIYVIVDETAYIEHKYPAFIAIPTPAGKPKAEIDVIRKVMLQNQLPIVFQRHGFMIGIPVMPGSDKDDVMSFVRDRLPNPSTEKRSEFAEAFQRSDVADAMIQVVVGNLGMFDELVPQQADLKKFLRQAPPEMKDIVKIGTQSQKLILEKLEYATVALDIRKLELFTAIQMKDETAAKTILGLYERTNKLAVKMMKGANEQMRVTGSVPAFWFLVFERMINYQDTHTPRLVGNEISTSFGKNAYLAIKEDFLRTVESAIASTNNVAPCSKNIRQFSIAFHIYCDALQTLPPTFSVDANGKPLHSWRVLILPYIEQNSLYEKIKLDEPWDSEHNKQFHNVNIPIYQCPGRKDLEPGMTTYSVVVGKETPFGTDGKGLPFSALMDGTSNTIMFVERATPVCWMCPDQEITFEEACKGINKSEKGIGGVHASGANFGFCDGSVHFISEMDDLKILVGDTTILKAMLTKAGGEGVPFLFPH